MVTIISFSLNFNLALTQKQFQMTDTTNWFGQGLNVNNMTGSFRITAPSGNPVYDNIVNYKNTPGAADMVLTEQLTNETTILGNLNVVPLEQGIYTIYYQVWDSANSLTYSCTETFNLQYASPTVQIQGVVNENNPSLTLNDLTVYIVNSVTPTLSRVPTITYPPTIIPPSTVPSTPPATTGTTAVTTSTYFFAPQTVQMSVVTNLTYSFAGVGSNSPFTVIDVVAATIPFCVPASNTCQLACGLAQYYNDWVLPNPQNEDYQDTYSFLSACFVTISSLNACGKGSQTAPFIAAMYGTAGFGDCCNACANSVMQVVGISGLVSIYNVTSANSYIGVTTTTSSGTTTFELTLQQAFIDSVNAVITQSAKNLEDISSLANISAFMFTDRIVIESTDSSVTVTTPTNTAQNAVFVTFEGYTNGDIVTLVEGTHTTAATFLVTTAVSIGGQIINYLTPQNAGAYTVIPNNPVTLSGGSGSGTVNVSWLTTYNLVVPPPTLQFQGATTPIANTLSAQSLFTGLVAANVGNYELTFTAVVDASDINAIEGFNFYFYDSVSIATPVGIAPTTGSFILSYFAQINGTYNISWTQKITAAVAGHTYNVAMLGTYNSSTTGHITITARTFKMSPCI